MKTRLQNRTNSNISEYTNGNISKNVFLTNLRNDIVEYYPNRIIKIVDSSDTRNTSVNPHIPIMFVNLDPENGENRVSYTFILNVDRIGRTNVITPELFLGALSYQLNNMDSITKNILDKLNIDDYKSINPDLETIWIVYLENHLEVLKHLREQHQDAFAFGLLNGVVPADSELEILIDKIHFDTLLDLQTDFIDVMESKYHLPAIFNTLIDRTYKSYKRLVK